MAPRPNWKGYLKLSLLSCPILLYPASSASERIAFRQINKQTGNRLRQQLVDAVTGDIVAGEDKGRGYEIGKEQYIPIEDDEIDSLQIESTRTIDIDKFVPRDQIDPRYIDSPYYIAPDGNVGQDAFAVIRERCAARRWWPWRGSSTQRSLAAEKPTERANVIGPWRAFDPPWGLRMAGFSRPFTHSSTTARDQARRTGVIFLRSKKRTELGTRIALNSPGGSRDHRVPQRVVHETPKWPLRVFFWGIGENH